MFAFLTSKSRLAVDREFMYIGSAGPGRADGRKARRADGRTGGRRTGGRTEGGRKGGGTDGRTEGGRADGRTDKRPGGRAQQNNDVHRF